MVQFLEWIKAWLKEFEPLIETATTLIGELFGEIA